MSQQFSSKIQVLWEKFLQAECASYERSTWFDGFLTQFLVEFKNGSSIQDILPFTPLAGVATLIGCELLSDVHQICSQPGDGEDLAPLRRHFLFGRGWRTLAVLHCLGVQDVSCGTELATLLISLYPVCLQPHSPHSKISTATAGPKSLASQDKESITLRNPYVALSGCWNKWGKVESSGNSSPGTCSSQGHRGYSLPGLLKVSPSDGIHYRKWSTSSRPSSIGAAIPQQTRTDQMKSHSSSSLSKQRRRSRNFEAADSLHKGASGTHNVTSESEAPQDASEVLLNKSNTLKIRLDPMDFDYFESVVRSEDELNGDQPLWRYSMRRVSSKVTAEDLTDEFMREVRSQTINCAEFSLLVVHLLEELCRTELLISTQQVSLQSVNFALENLCSLQFGSAPVDVLLSEEVIELKLAMTQLLLTALDKVLIQSEIINQLINAGVLPVMLRVLEDAVRRAESLSEVDITSSKSFQAQSKASIPPLQKLKTPESEVLDEVCGLHEFVMGILYGAVTFLHCLLLHRSSTERIHEFQEQFRLFASSYGGRLVEKTVSALVNCASQVNKNSVNRGRKVVFLVVQLILSLKQARSTIVHSLQCRKTRHKQCKAVDARRHHHNDLFGNPFGSMSARNVGVGHHSSTCNVAYLFSALVRILNTNSHLPDFCVPLMKVMLDCGTCCCYPAKGLLSCLTKILKTGNAKARALGFTLLEHTVFTELGAVDTTSTKPLKEYFRCSVCNRSVESLAAQPASPEDNNDDTNLIRGEDGLARDHPKFDSEKPSLMSVSSDRSESSDTKQYNWSCLDFYRDLLCSEDPKLCHTAASHLLKLSPRCSEKVQIALLSNVFYPSFVQSKMAYLAHEKDVSRFIILSCLSAFSSLISSLPLAETFLSLGGLQHILDLMTMPPFLRLCCSVLEIVIVVDIVDVDKSSMSQRMRRNEVKQPYPAASTPSQRVGQLTSLVKLIECLELHSNELLDKMENEEESAGDILNNSNSTRRPQLKLLQHVVVFWQTAANLALCSPQLRSFFASHSMSSLGFVLLRAILPKIIFSSNWKRLTSNRDTESFLYMRLIESVLVFHLTAPPVSVQTGLPTSRDILIDNLESTLCRPEVLTLSERSPRNAGSLRRLCDVLIRCALAEASSEQVLPAVRKAKLPTLMVTEMFPEENDDLEDANDEERDNLQVLTDKNLDKGTDQTGLSEDGSSVEDPYVTADEGYEADIEVLESKPNGISIVYDSSTSGSLGLQQNFAESGETNKTNSDKKYLNVIAYPKLCSVSINLLVYLYNEVQNLSFEEQSNSKESDDSCSLNNSSNHNDPNISNECDKKRQDFRERLREKSSTLKSQLLSDMVHLVQRIVALCRESGKSCMVLSQEGVIDTLLTGFSSFLSAVNPEFLELQSVVLELVGLLAQHSITSQELSKYLHFFKGENPPLESLLQPLTTLVTSARPQPNFILCFPVAATLTFGQSVADVEQSTKSVSESPQRKTSGLLSLAANTISGNSRNGSSSDLSRAANETPKSQNAAVCMAQSIRCIHLASGTPSAWSECALVLPIDADLGWCAWLSGFSISLWLRLERSAAPESATSVVDHRRHNRNYSGHLSDSLSDSWSEWGVVSSASWLKEGLRTSNNAELRGHLHVVSIGADNLLLEVWADVSSDRLHLKLRRSDGKTNEVVAECVTETGLPPGQWHHLALNVHDYVQRKKSVIEVTIIIDGLREIKCPLQFNGIVLRKAKPTCLLVGHAVHGSNGSANTAPSHLSPGRGSWYLGNLQLFKCPVFNRERAVYLVGLGPSHTSLTDCKVGRESPNFTNIFGAKILNSGITWDTVLDNGAVNLKELQHNLLIAYSAQNPLTMNVYPQVVGNSGSSMGSLFPGHPGFRVVTPDQRASQQLPLAIKPTQYGPLNTQQYRGLVSAVSTLGGAHVFLFLFARVVELNASEVEQGKALYLLLKLVQSDTSLFSQFVQEDCHKLLLKVLASQRCIPGHHMLKAVLDACCDKPVLQHQPGPQCQFRVVPHSEAIVVNSFLLSTIVGSWRDWERVAAPGEEGGVLGTLFRALLVLLRDEHPFREFNASQFNRVRLVEALLLFCKERFLYEDRQPLHVSVCGSLVELVRSLMGAPPEFSHVVAVADCLLLLHPASATYITHVRPSYYFLLSPSPPSVTPQPPPQSKTRSGLFENRQKGKKNQNAIKNKLPPSVRREQVSAFAQPVDPSKLNKALTNLQIKKNDDEVQNGRNSYLRSPNQSMLDDEIDSNKIEKGSEVSASDFDADLVEGCGELTAFDSGIAGSFRDQAGCSDADVREGHTNERENLKQPELLDRADLLIMQAEVCENLECNLEKFTTEMNLKENQYVLDHSSSLPNGKEKEGTQDTKDANSNQEESDSNSSNNSLCLVVEGLLLLLRDTLLVLPDNMANQVLNHVVQAETLLVMTNNSDARVRSAVVKVLGAFLQRATEEEISKFVKMKGFYQLASQLGLYPATLDLVESCAALVTQRGDTSIEELLVSLTEQLDLDQLVMSPLQLSAFPPLLGLLPRAIHDVALTHNSLAFIREVLQQVKGALRPLLDAGLLEVLLKLLVLVAHQPPEPTDIVGTCTQDLLISDINVFLISIMGLVLSTPGNQSMQVLNDIQLQLAFLHQLESSSCGKGSRCVTVLQDAHCTVLDGTLSIIIEKLSSQSGQTKGHSHFSASYDDKLGSSRAMDSGHFRVPIMSLSLSHHSSFSSQGGSLLRSKAMKDVSRSELYDRFKTILVKAVEFFTYSEPCDESVVPVSEVEETFVRRLFANLLEGLCSVVDRRSVDSKSLWSGAMWAARDTLRVRTAQLFVWLLSPWQPLRIKMFAIHSLRSEPRVKDLFTSMLHTHAQVEQKFTVWLWALVYRQGFPQLQPADLRACEELKEQLQRWGVLSPHAVGHSHDNWEGEVTLLLREAERQRVAFVTHARDSMEKSVHKMEHLHCALVDGAMTATRSVVEVQNGERKVFMEHIKSTFNENVQLRMKWQHLIQLLTHERAVWFFAESYPMSWQLDATEGPARVRKRLQRCHLHIQDKFLMPDQQEKLEHLRRPAPLQYLFGRDPKASSTSSLMIDRLHTNEKIQYMCIAHIITPACEIAGELLIGESCLYFVADDSTNKNNKNMCEVQAGQLDMSSTVWQFDDVKEIINRRYQLQERSLEIFLLNGRTYLVAFETAEERDAFLHELSQCELVNLMQGENLSDVLEMWREGTISNWEYVTQLNKMAGRSYNDLMQYPVFPFVLADYTSSNLDLLDAKSFRNFKKPMAVQNKCNEQHYIDMYNYWKQELSSGLGVAGRNESYHYGSHYSNSGIVLHFLVRLPPFTGMFLQYQDNNFDLPDRTFHSLHTTWRLTSSDSTTDVKEMIPEFFFLSEFLVNYEGFHFGVRQSGERIDSVQLPPWCLNDPRLFVLIHRQALESAYVRENLPHWIDLVFGYKQSGKAAVDAINVFHPATYCGFDVASIKDPLDRKARETMVRTYGQMPRQLFRSLHPMAQQSLTLKAVSHSVPPVLPSVQGLLWGSYVGSLADPEPVLVAKHQHRTVVADLVPLHSNDAFGLGPHTSILLCYSKEKALSLINSSVVQNVALATWGHADSIVRIKLKKEQPPWPVVRAPELDPICVCASVPDCHQLWMGHLSGRLVVFRYNFEPVRGQLDFNSDPVALLGHTSAVLKIHLSRSFSIAVSASQDHTAIIWDLNSLSYIRTIRLGSAVSLVSVSETLGDIVTVCHKSLNSEKSNNSDHSYNPWAPVSGSSSADAEEDVTYETESPSPGVPDDWEILNEAETSKESDTLRDSHSSWSLKGMQRRPTVESLSSSKNILNFPQSQTVRGSSLSLHTVNATLVGTINTAEQITAVCFSTAPEGLSVNVIATGLFNGTIRLWSSWDLMPVREISSPALTYPIISLTYSHDSQHLYVSSSDGVVAIWEGGGIKGTNKTPKFFNLTFM